MLKKTCDCHCITLYYSAYFTVFPRTTRIRHQIQVPAAGLMMAGGLTKAKVDANAQEIRQI